MLHTGLTRIEKDREEMSKRKIVAAQHEIFCSVGQQQQHRIDLFSTRLCCIEKMGICVEET